MSSVELSDEVLARLRAEATRCGSTVEAIISELAAQLPGQRGPDRPAAPGDEPTHRLRFVGVGASGRTEPLDIHRERAELAEKKFSEGI